MKVERKSLIDAAVETLRREIIGGRFPPGSRLTELGLAAQMGIGRSTVRTALLELEKDDLVQRSRYSAWAVPDLTPQVVWEVYTLRGALEGLAAHIVASALSESDRETLLAAYARLGAAEKSDDDAERMEADLNFHRTIVVLARHERLAHQYDILVHKIEWIYRWSDELWSRRIVLPDWHQPVLDAILAQDPERAERAIRDITSMSLGSDLVDLEQESRTSA